MKLFCSIVLLTGLLAAATGREHTKKTRNGADNTSSSSPLRRRTRATKESASSDDCWGIVPPESAVKDGEEEDAAFEAMEGEAVEEGGQEAPVVGAMQKEADHEKEDEAAVVSAMEGGNGEFNTTADGVEALQTAAYNTLEYWMIYYTNQYRRENGYAALCGNSKLMAAARRSASEQAGCNAMAHTTCRGSSMRSRIDATGYRWNSIGENVAYHSNCGTDQQCAYKAVYEMWARSSGHRANMLGNFVHTGQSGARSSRGWLYLTQVFARSTRERCDFTITAAMEHLE